VPFASTLAAEETSVYYFMKGKTEPNVIRRA